MQWYHWPLALIHATRGCCRRCRRRHRCYTLTIITTHSQRLYYYYALMCKRSAGAVDAVVRITTVVFLLFCVNN